MYSFFDHESPLIMSCSCTSVAHRQQHQGQEQALGRELAYVACSTLSGSDSSCRAMHVVRACSSTSSKESRCSWVNFFEANIVTTGQHFWHRPQQNARFRGSGPSVAPMSVSSTNTEISQAVWAAMSGRWKPGSKSKIYETCSVSKG